MKIGIDVGWTIKGVRAHGFRNTIAPDSLYIISELVKRGDDVFLISKVNSEQKKEVEDWLAKTDFFNQTGVKPENLYFCFERRDKAIFVKALGIEMMIDDRTEVMASLSPLVKKFLLDPDVSEYEQHKRELVNYTVVRDWASIGKAIL